jgi:GTP-binding protein
MFIDEVGNIIFAAGHGGPGRVSFRRPPERGPDGGNGGQGGSLYLTAVDDLLALAPLATQKRFTAANGQSGGRNRRSGAAGVNLTIALPVGTTIFSQSSGQLLAELTQVGQKLLFCCGGLGGRGNFEFRSSTNTTPQHAQPGLPGQSHCVRLVLKLVADYGLIGLPNAGKSSLLNALTRAHAKVAAYPFTTLEPNLGVLHHKVIADVPGLIAGAARGKGLGIKFLKHIEKVKLLLHCLSAESEDLLGDYQIIHRELANYSPDLINKTEIILLTKIDLINQSELKNCLATLRKLKKKIIPVSVYKLTTLKSLAAVFKHS